MKTNDQTTKRPWAWCNDNTCLYGNENKEKSTQDCIIHCSRINAPDEANAELIVKAVNCHDELIEALKKAREILYAYETGQDGYPKALILQPNQASWPEEIEQALAKAKQ